MVNRGAIVVPLFAVAVTFFLFYEPPPTKKVEEEPLDPTMWWSPLSQEKQEAEMLFSCKEREAGYRTELEQDPDSWKVHAKLAMSLLETNASRVRPRWERYEEGKAFAERALAKQPDNWRSKIAKVYLLLADFNDTQTEEASRLAEATVGERQNRFTNLAMGKAFLVDGCALMCRWRRFSHLKQTSPEGAVFPEGKDPDKMMLSYMKAAHKRMVDAGRRLHAAVDAELCAPHPPKTYHHRPTDRAAEEAVGADVPSPTRGAVAAVAAAALAAAHSKTASAGIMKCDDNCCVCPLRVARLSCLAASRRTRARMARRRRGACPRRSSSWRLGRTFHCPHGSSHTVPRTLLTTCVPPSHCGVLRRHDVHGYMTQVYAAAAPGRDGAAAAARAPKVDDPSGRVRRIHRAQARWQDMPAGGARTNQEEEEKGQKGQPGQHMTAQQGRERRRDSKAARGEGAASGFERCLTTSL